MTENSLLYGKVKQNTWVYKLLIYISFVWISIYPTFGSSVYSFEVGYGNIMQSGVIYSMVTVTLMQALVAWASFEIMFWLYRYVLTFKIYSYIVPMDSLKAESRAYFIYRNVFYGLFYNLCFIFPFLESYITLANILITLTVLIFYAKHLNQIYSDPIIGHFVFKNFCMPIFIYEGICVLYYMMVVL